MGIEIVNFSTKIYCTQVPKKTTTTTKKKKHRIFGIIKCRRSQNKPFLKQSQSFRSWIKMCWVWRWSSGLRWASDGENNSHLILFIQLTLTLVNHLTVLPQHTIISTLHRVQLW